MRRAHSFGVHLAAVVLLGVGACSFEPVFQDGTISCRDERDCPPSYVCVNPGVCYARTHTVDGSVLDAFARPNDAAAADRASSDVAGAGGISGAGGAAGGGGRIIVDGGAGQGGAGALDGGGETACGQGCTLGAQRCGTTGLETCIMVGTCPAFGADVACPGRQTCQGVAPTALCACPAAPAGCTGPGSVCSNGDAVTCDVDEQGCLYQKSVDACATGKPCGGSFPTAACTCPAVPAVCGGKGGTYCSGTTAVVTCALDGNGCLAVTQTTPCGASTPCSVTNNVATCSCAAPPAECAAGAGGVCRANGQLATCAIDGQGCLSVTNAASCATGLTCQGTAPAGACKCPAVPAACNGGMGKYCQGTGAVVTCAIDGSSNCLVITSTTPCPGAQTCGGSAGVAACACPALPAACPGGAGKLCNVSGQLVTCVADANGCVSVAATTTCATSGLVCGGTFPAAACTCPAAPAGCQGTTGTFCSGNSTFKCALDGNNCLAAGSLVPCASDLVCGGALGAAMCVCPAAPSACMGATTGNVCQSGTSYVTCGPTAHGCVQVTSAAGTCPGGSKTCTGSPGAAACACNTTPSASCTTGGVFGSGNACSGTQLIKCSVDGNGCDLSALGPCGSPMTCSGALPSAVCACPSPYNPTDCSGGLGDGSHCTGTTLYTCSDAGSGCQQLATTACASNQLCVGSYPGSRCASEEQLGTPGAAGGQESWTNLLVGVKINVPVASTLRRFGIAWNGNGAGTALSRLSTFALYKDGGGGPSGSLLASAIDRTVNAIGPVEFNLTTPAGGLALLAGDYWVFVNLNMAGYVARNTSPTTPILTANATYGGALPATVTPASFMSGSMVGPLGLWLVVIPQQ